MKKLLKSEVYGSREQVTKPMGCDEKGRDKNELKSQIYTAIVHKQ